MEKNDTVLRGAVRGGEKKLGETGKGAFSSLATRALVRLTRHPSEDWLRTPSVVSTLYTIGDENPWLVEGPLQS